MPRRRLPGGDAPPKRRSRVLDGVSSLPANGTGDDDALMQVILRTATGEAARLPLGSAAQNTAMRLTYVLRNQSRVSNNAELLRIRASRTEMPRYYAVKSDLSRSMSGGASGSSSVETAWPTSLPT
jgi:hypothetical protein